MSPGEFAGVLRGMAGRVETELAVVVRQVTTIAAEQARAYIGQEKGEWPPLADSTVMEKVRLGYTGQVSATDPLLRTGGMRSSIEMDVDGLIGVVGSNDKKALWQEFGASGTGRGHSGTIPPRPFIGLAMKDTVEEALEPLLVQAAERIFSGG